MVYARTKMLLEDNCFEEEPGEVAMSFITPNATKFYQKMYELMRSIFNVPESHIQEVDYSWGKSKDKEKFKVTWWLHKDMDIFTYLYVRFKVSGEGNGGLGKVNVGVRGLIRTEYPQETVWQRSLFYEMLRTFWHRAFYRKKREEYAEECRHLVIFYQRKIREFYEELKKSA
jgi:hypothetical protein